MSKIVLDLFMNVKYLFFLFNRNIWKSKIKYLSDYFSKICINRLI